MGSSGSRSWGQSRGSWSSDWHSSPQVAVSAASDDPQRQYNQAQMDDMTQEERMEAMLDQEEEDGDEADMPI